MKKRRAKPGLMDLWVLVPVLLLVFIGLWLVFDASYATAAESGITGHDMLYYFKRQIAFTVAGLIAMLVMSRVRLSRLQKVTPYMMWASIIMLVLVLVPGIGHGAKGANRWFALGPISVQPSEVAKIALVLYLAGFLSQGKSVVRRMDRRWVVPALAAGAVTGLILIEPDMGTAFAVVLMCFAMLFAAGVKKWQLGALGLAGMAAAVGAVKLEPYRMERIRVWLDPWKHRYDEGYQIVHSLIALGTGGVLGVGMCEGREKMYTPEPHTDMIFATLGEEFGLLVCLGLLALFLVFIYKGLDVASRANTVYGNLVAVGITSMIGLQALTNIAVVSASIPATGVPLPFMSYGGSAMVMTLASVGILLSISRQRSGSDA